MKPRELYNISAFSPFLIILYSLYISVRSFPFFIVEFSEKQMIIIVFLLLFCNFHLISRKGLIYNYSKSNDYNLFAKWS